MIEEIPGIIKIRSDEIAQIEQTFSNDSWNKTCQASFNRALHYGLTDYEKGRLEKQLKSEALKLTEATVRGLFAPQVADQVMDYVRSLNFGGPMTLSEFQIFIEQNMRMTLERIQKPTRICSIILSLCPVFAEIVRACLIFFCNTWIFEPIRDSVQGNSIILSTYSAKNYEIGLSIAIHEMGHAVSMALDLLRQRGSSISPFVEIRSCLSANYLNDNRKPPEDYPRFLAIIFGQKRTGPMHFLVTPCEIESE